MNTTAVALVGFIAWYLVLLGMIGALRVTTTMGGKPANSFRPDGTDVSPFSARLCRAHANCYEAFPFAGGLLLLALATQTTAITHGLALAFVAARIGQSAVHLASTSVPAVQLRFALFLAQFGIAIYWTIGFARAFAS